MAKKDIISKHVLKHLAADIANLLLGLDIEDDSVELLPTEKHRIELRHADLVVRVRQRDSQEHFILHVEIQNSNDAQMSLRMLRYYTDIQLAYPSERIRQYMVYIGEGGLRMPAVLDAGDFTYRYHILDMHTVDCSILLTKDTPDALVLAILCDFRGRPVQEMVNYIVKRLHELLGDDERGFRNYFEMLETLSQNRRLQPNIDEAKHMLTQVDVQKFASYKWGLEKGREEARSKSQRIARQLLSVMDNQRIAEITDLPLEEVQLMREASFGDDVGGG